MIIGNFKFRVFFEYMEITFLNFRIDEKIPREKEIYDLSLVCNFKIFTRILLEATVFKVLRERFLFLISVL